MGDNDIKTTVARRLDILMMEAEKKGIKQKQISIETGIPSNTFSQYHNEKREIKADNLVKLARYFNVSTDYLLGLTDVKSPNINVQQVCQQIGGLSEEALKTICLIYFMVGKSSCCDEAIKEDDKCCKINEKYIDSPYDTVFYFNQLLKNREQFIDFLEVFGELSYNAKQRMTRKKIYEIPLMAQKYQEYIEKYPECRNSDDSEEIARERFRFSQEALKLLDAAEADYTDLKVE